MEQENLSRVEVAVRYLSFYVCVFATTIWIMVARSDLGPGIPMLYAAGAVIGVSVQIVAFLKRTASARRRQLLGPRSS